MLKSVAIFLTLFLSGATVAQSTDIGPISGLLFDMRNSAPTDKEGFRARALQNFSTLAADRRFNYPLVRLLSDNSPDAILLFGLQPSDLAQLLELDLDENGALDQNEVQVWADDAFQRYDEDENEILSPQEITKIENDLAAYRARNPTWNQMQASSPTPNATVIVQEPPTYIGLGPTLNPNGRERLDEIASKCFIPAISPSERLALFSFYEGTKRADITLSGQDGDETFVVDVAVEEGDDPLYVVLSSHGSTLYRFTGAVDRISRVVPTSTTRKSNSGEGIGGTGVIGVAKEKVSYLGGWNCLNPFHEAGGMDEAKARGELFRILGRQPDYIGTAYSLDAVKLPTMKASIPAIDYNAREKDGLPLIAVDPATVISAIPAERWEILPGVAGIKQLVHDGYLELLKDKGYQQEYKIIKSFPRFPPAISGTDYKFLLGRGVRSPEGFAGWSCILSEETGLPIGQSSRPDC